jgi:molybdopterin synthase catalytic subunit
MEYVGAETRLAEGDEVAVLPPLSGGSGGGRGGALRAHLVEAPIDVQELLRQVGDPACGGVAMFLGVVREPNLGHRTLHIDYHAYPEMAVRVMEEIGAEAQARWEVGRIALVHRTGRLSVGEISVAIVVAAAHRQAALEACAYLIEALKARVPIWKKETFEGGQVWIEGDMVR